MLVCGFCSWGNPWLGVGEWGGGTLAASGFLSPAPSKMFLMVTRLYFSAEEGGERSVCLTFAFLFLLLAMLVQVVQEETLELGLEPGTRNVWGHHAHHSLKEAQDR